MNTELNNPTIVESAKTESAMTKAIALYSEIVADDTIPVKVRRRIFINRAVNELGLTEKGASTYMYNAKRHVDGGDKYAHNRKKKSTTEAAPVETVEVPGVVSTVVVETEVLNRWCVEDRDTKTIVDSFTSRAAAINYNQVMKEKGNNTRWFDKTKVA